MDRNYCYAHTKEIVCALFNFVIYWPSSLELFWSIFHRLQENKEKGKTFVFVKGKYLYVYFQFFHLT